VPLVTEELIIKYLLGMLYEDKQVWFEEMFFLQDSVFERLLIVEQALIDRYLQGRLSEKERKAFEHNFLRCTIRRRRLGKPIIKGVSDMRAL
jgi:hypothetical protein